MWLQSQQDFEDRYHQATNCRFNYKFKFQGILKFYSAKNALHQVHCSALASVHLEKSEFRFHFKCEEMLDNDVGMKTIVFIYLKQLQHQNLHHPASDGKMHQNVAKWHLELKFQINYPT